MTALLILLSGCNTVKIKDETFWALKPAGLGALEAHYLANIPDKDITQDQWNAIAPGKICMGINSYADFKQIIESLCSYHSGECIYPTIQTATDKVIKTATRAWKAKK